MLEINPMVVTKDERVIALDAKMSFDDNALFRHSNVAEMRDLSQEDSRRSGSVAGRPELCGLGRRHRLHHQWRWARDGHDGHDQVRRR